MRKAFLFVAVFVVIAVFLLTFSRNDRIAACAKVRIGDDKETVRGLLGEHYRIDTIGDRHGWHLYKSNFLSAGPVRILIDDASRKVLAIQCSESGPTIH